MAGGQGGGRGSEAGRGACPLQLVGQPAVGGQKHVAGGPVAPELRPPPHIPPLPQQPLHLRPRRTRPPVAAGPAAGIPACRTQLRSGAGCAGCMRGEAGGRGRVPPVRPEPRTTLPQMTGARAVQHRTAQRQTRLWRRPTGRRSMRQETHLRRQRTGRAGWQLASAASPLRQVPRKVLPAGTGCSGGCRVLSYLHAGNGIAPRVRASSVSAS